MLDLKNDMREQILATLPLPLRGREKARRELREMRIDRLLSTFLNWRSRVPQPAHYKLHVSETLLANGRAAERSVALNQMFNDMRSGRSLWKYLSRQVAHFGYEPGNRKQSRAKDLLLNDWGIHHFHVGTILDPDGFVARPRSEDEEKDVDLLFLAIQGASAFIIDIGTHDDLKDDRVICTMIDEWPTAGLAYELVGIPAGRAGMTSVKRYRLRKAGYVGWIERGGKVFVPGSGFLNTACTNSDAVRAADFILEKIEEFEQLVAMDPTFLPNVYRQAGKQAPALPRLRFRFNGRGYSAVDLIAHVRIPLDVPNYGLRFAA